MQANSLADAILQALDASHGWMTIEELGKAASPWPEATLTNSCIHRATFDLERDGHISSAVFPYPEPRISGHIKKFHVRVPGKVSD